MTRTDHDIETRTRLLEAAARLFAQRGFAHVTVRDICGAAQANIAAVNYHFPGKAGLYDEVVGAAIRLMQETTAEAQRAGEHGTPEERLRAFVRVMLTRTAPGGDGAWVHHIMLRELTDPTPALVRVADEVMMPRMVYLRSIVAELLGCDTRDARVARCAFSVHAQCIAMMNRLHLAQALNEMSPLTSVPAESIETMAEHITEFSLAGLWALARTT